MSVLTSDSLILPVYGDLGTLLVGISGGMDSVVLAHLLIKSGHKVELAHVNYGLRGAESNQDEQFVRAFADRVGSKLHVLHAKDPRSVQTWARRVRYDWFQELSTDAHIRYVAVAHHQDDQLETMLLNLQRGTGLSGLSGMRYARLLGDSCEVIRPLLGVSRGQIADYARLNGLSWREDASNKDGRYTRNQVRNELLQMPASEYESFLQAGMQLQKTVSNIRQKIVALCFGRDMTSVSTTFRLDMDEWKAAPHWAQGWILLEILQQLDASAPRRESVVMAIEGLARGKTGKKATFGRVDVWKEREGLMFVRSTVKAPQTDSGLSDENTAIPEGSFSFDLSSGVLVGENLGRISPENINHHPKEAFLDADLLHYPLIIRKWQPGDRFSPLGLAGSQKLKSFLTNQKVPSSGRKEVSVLVSGGKVAWVVGMRIDEAFKVTSKTERILNVKWYPRSAE